MGKLVSFRNVRGGNLRLQLLEGRSHVEFAGDTIARHQRVPYLVDAQGAIGNPDRHRHDDVGEPDAPALLIGDRDFAPQVVERQMAEQQNGHKQHADDCGQPQSCHA